MEKVKLLDMVKEGQSYAAVARHYGMNESTIRYIKKDEKNIRATAAVSINQAAKRVVSSRNKNIVRMETALAIWIQDCRKKSITLDGNTIRTQAKKLYDTFANQGGSEGGSAAAEQSDSDNPDQPSSTSGGFSASKGWFDRFQKRYQLKSVSLQGEAASADKEAAARYTNETFKSIIEEGGYQPVQVFNMDETGLFWKRMPKRTYIMKEEARAPGFKAYKDRVTLVMCGNAAGFMIKPALIYKAKNPRALKNKNKNQLPVHWMHNSKAWMTKVLTTEWFHNCFIPAVKVYLAQLGIAFKVLLLMDNAGGHAMDLSYEGVQVEFLPPNTTSLIQPMDQGVIRAFKALYTRNSLNHLVESMNNDENFNLKDYWRNYTIATCLENIQKALKEMKKETVHACWKKLWPDIIHNYEGFSPDEVHHSAVDKAIRLAKLLGGEGFQDMTQDDVNDLIETHSAPLTDEDLTELTKSASEEEVEEQEEEEEDEGLSIERLGRVVRTANDLKQMLAEWDPDMVRSLQFQNSIDGAIQVYKNLLAQKKKHAQQLSITMFFPKQKKAASTPSTSTATSDVELEVLEQQEDNPPTPEEAPAEPAPSEEQ